MDRQPPSLFDSGLLVRAGERAVNKLRTQKGIIIDYELEEGATHFWQDHIGAVETRVGAYLDKRLTEKPA